jgi:hypothetical protein
VTNVGSGGPGRVKVLASGSDREHPQLEELMEELQACVEQTGPTRVSSTRQNLARAEQLLRRSPLVHGMREASHLRSALEGRALRSRNWLKLPTLPSEQYLGFRDVVYTCAGVLYPQRRIALVFAWSAENAAEVTASPWDTGSFCASDRLCPGLPLPPAEDRRVLFQKTCLPAPQYRTYLVHYVASCFGAPEDYFSQRNHRYDDPARAMSAEKWQSRVFEVRFRVSLPITSTSLLALFLPRNMSNRDSLAIRALFDRIKGPGATLREYENEHRLVSEVRSWIQKHIREEAAR